MPSAPTSVTGVAGNTEIAVTWVAGVASGGSAITGYKIEQSINSGSTWTEAVADTGDTLTSTVTGLVNGTPYVFRITAINAAGDSSVSTASAATTPSSTTITLDSNSITLGSASGSDTKTMTLTASSTPSSDVTVTIQGTANSCTFSPSSLVLTTTTGTFDVTADSTQSGTCTLTFATTSSDSNYNGLTITALVVTLQGTPAPPTNLLAVSTGLAGELKLDWTAPSDIGNAVLKSYHIEKSVDAGSTWTVAVADTGDTLVTNTLTGLIDGQAYSVRVATLNTITTSDGGTVVGTSTFSNVVDVSVAGLPSPPTNVLVSSTGVSQELKIDWTAPVGLVATGSIAITGYTIEQSVDGGSTWTVAANTGTTAVTNTLSGLANGVEHQIRIQSHNAIGSSATFSVVARYD